jgi:hypothetical protein
MGKTHYLDLNTLLTYLRNRSGRLTTTFQVSGQPCTGSITLVRGQITACVFAWSNGRLEGAEAFDQLRLSKEWQMHYDDGPHSSSPAQQTPPLPVASSMPQPTYPLSPALLTGYSARQRIILRMVHTLVDGQRSIAQIKAQLNLPPETIDTALDVLRQLGAIH